MSSFLLELFFEEIPALMQKDAEIGYQQIFNTYFQKNEIVFDKVEVFSTPRRITIYVHDVQPVISQKTVEFKGPKVNSMEGAISGFCKSHNITKDKLTTKNIGDNIFYFYERYLPEQNVMELLQQDLPELIKSYVWQKSMFWGEYDDISAIRPMRNILCMLDAQVIPMQYGHLLSNNITQGHRVMGKKNIVVNSVQEYFNLLADNFVILDANQRKKNIIEQIEKLLGSQNLTIKYDENLLDEVVGLVEYPVVMIGNIKEKFMLLPKEILITTMKNHQKYFSVINNNGDFAPYFIFVSNIEVQEKSIIINGNERVVNARLSDALYFYEHDINASFTEWLSKLSNMVFHIKLGNMADKVNRIKNICGYLDNNNQDLQTAATICKNDLASTVVNELPELQGIMGYYYALHNGYNNEIALAIKDHYQPLGPNSKVPSGIAGLLALSDKIDSLVGLMLAGHIPTGSKDPFALRRAALGVIRIIIENKLNIDLVELIKFSIEQYYIPKESKYMIEDFLDNKKNIQNINIDFVLSSENALTTIVTFFEERIKYFLKNEHSMRLINAVLDLNRNANLNLLLNNIAELQVFLSMDIGEELVATYKRINNILGNSKVGELKLELFKTPAEQNLYNIFNSIINELSQNLTNALSFKLGILTKLIEPINQFFDKVMIKDQNVDIANNRLTLLHEIRKFFDKIINFSAI